MKTRHALTALCVALVLAPVGLFGMLLLAPVALVLLAALPLFGIVAVGALAGSAARAPQPAVARAHIPIPRMSRTSGPAR